MNRQSTRVGMAQVWPRVFFCGLLLEFLLTIFSGVGLPAIHGDPFFMVEIDPAYWLVFGINLPQLLVNNVWLSVTFEISILFLFAWLIYKPSNYLAARLLILLLFIFYITLMGYLTHRNFQSGLFLALIPFIFRKEINKKFAFEATRYFLLFFYGSGAILKLWHLGLFDTQHFSQALQNQFSVYFLEGNLGFRTRLNIFLVGHPAITYSMYLGAFLVELFAFTGFFTKKFDGAIACLLLFFHAINWLIMDIAPIGQLSFVCLLFFSRYMKIPVSFSKQE